MCPIQGERRRLFRQKGAQVQLTPFFGKSVADGDAFTWPSQHASQSHVALIVALDHGQAQNRFFAHILQVHAGESSPISPSSFISLSAPQSPRTEPAETRQELPSPHGEGFQRAVTWPAPTAPSPTATSSASTKCNSEVGPVGPCMQTKHSTDSH